MGRAAAFSFYPGKNLGACGEAGAATTNDPGDGRQRSGCCAITGRLQKYVHDIEGYNGRLDSIQAGLLQVKLPHLAEWNKLRRDRAAEYNRLLARERGAGLPVRAIVVASRISPLCHSHAGIAMA